MNIKPQTNIKKEEILLSKYIFIGNINIFFELVKQTGYPYFEWNDMVYKVDENDYKPTHISIYEAK